MWAELFSAVGHDEANSRFSQFWERALKWVIQDWSYLIFKIENLFNNLKEKWALYVTLLVIKRNVNLQYCKQRHL